MPGDQVFDELPPDAATPEFQVYSQVQQLAFIRGHLPGHGESCYKPLILCDEEVVLEVHAYFPLRRFRRCRLNARDRLQVGLDALAQANQ